MPEKVIDIWVRVDKDGDVDMSDEDGMWSTANACASPIHVYHVKLTVPKPLPVLLECRAEVTEESPKPLTRRVVQS